MKDEERFYIAKTATACGAVAAVETRCRWVFENLDNLKKFKDAVTTRKFEWTGLTDEEMLKIESETTCNTDESWLRNVTRAIEAALKEKNT